MSEDPALRGYRISTEDPSVYISYEGTGAPLDPLEARFLESGRTGQSKRDGDDIWLRLHNNSYWAISFNTFSIYGDGEPEMIEIPKASGTYKFALGDGIEVGIFYRVREKNGKFLPVYGTDMYWVSNLPPGRSVIFSVSRKHLSREREIAVKFNYEWEDGQSSTPSQSGCSSTGR